uniref:Ig-like domain-containing protein n=1 Tax=Panagrellus redivivus TaxID=6233 RepID=A0A7E5A1B9_PANRE
MMVVLPFIVAVFCLLGQSNSKTLPSDVQLTTTNNNYMSMIAGFTARFQCTIYRCSWDSPQIAWFKDDVIIFNGTEFVATSGFEPANIVLQRTQTPEYQTQDTCVTLDYTLLIKNLTLDDAGKYRCQLMDFPQQLDFQLDVLESGLKAGFHENITYDHTECCIEKGISPLCRAMCKPRDMHLDFFDPTSCQTSDYKNFLSCATDGGRRNYIPCCRQRSVPSFCFDFCSNNFRMLKRSHRLCLYYLPEIFGCFSKQSSLYPETPIHLTVSNSSGEMDLCWRVPEHTDTDGTTFSVHLKEVPETIMHGDVSLVNPSGDRIDSNNRTPRNAVVMVAHESVVNEATDFEKIPPESVIQGPDSTMCIKLNQLEKQKRYVAFVQSSNDFGVSDPSAPLFISINDQNNSSFTAPQGP